MLKMHSRLITLTLFVSIPAISSPLGGDAEAGKLKAFSCQFCHGTNGIATQPGYPHLNGQNDRYLFNSMKAYQNNERTGAYDDMMKQQLSMMQDQDLADIAAFYSKMGN